MPHADPTSGTTTAATTTAAGADAAVVARDPALPALADVLDADRFRDRLLGAWPATSPRPTDAVVTYLRYKPATHLVAAVTLTHADGGRERAALFAAPDAADPKLAKVADRAARLERGWGQVVGDDGTWIVTPAAVDRHLPAAARLGHHLGRLDAALRAAEIVPLAYKPHRRLVARLDRRGRPRAVVKVHHRRAARAVARTARWVATTAGAHDLPLPGTVALDPGRGLHVTAWVRGTTLDRLALDDPTLAELGGVLARLHRAPAAGLPAAPAGADADARAALAVLRPAAAARAAATAIDPSSRIAARVPVHGDLSADQVVHRGDGLSLLDLDRAHAGTAVDDLASWVAAEAVHRDALDHPTLPAALRTGYLAAGGPASLGDLDAAVGRALLRRAGEPFRLRHPDWAARTDRIVDAAVVCFARAASR